MRTRIKELRLKLGMSLAKLEELTGISAQQLNRLEKGERRVNDGNIKALCEAFQVTPRLLFEDDERMVPIHGEVSGGPWTETLDKAVDEHLIYHTSRRHNNFIALRVRGDSMNRWAADGQYIIVDISKKDHLQLNGHAVVATRGTEGTFKIFRHNPDRLEPFSSSPDYQTLFIDHDWCIVGEVIDAIRNPEIIPN